MIEFITNVNQATKMNKPASMNRRQKNNSRSFRGNLFFRPFCGILNTKAIFWFSRCEFRGINWTLRVDTVKCTLLSKFDLNFWQYFIISFYVCAENVQISIESWCATKKTRRKSRHGFKLSYDWISLYELAIANNTFNGKKCTFSASYFEIVDNGWYYYLCNFYRSWFFDFTELLI